jgi:LytR cell envelope-related transcriptional attenuator
MDIVEQIGAYAGFASVLGLAVLSALYFSQARDVRRLREWAGRAPERAAEQEARIQAATAQQAPAGQTGAKPAAAPAPGAPAVPGKGAVPGPPPPVPGAPPKPGVQPAPGASPAGAGAAAAATGAAAAGTATADPPKPPPPPPAAKPAGTGGAPPPPPAKPTPLPPLPSRSPAPAGAGGQTSILPPSMRPKQPWYRRMAPRYMALIVAGVLIVGGGAAYGVTQLLEDEEPATQPASGGGGEAAPEEEPGRAAAVKPSDVTVAVLNGTTVTGLASQIADRLEREGFQRGNTTNFTEQARNESVVLYSSGHQREARAVAKRLGVNQIERIDAETQVLAGDATVAVVVGADLTN